MYYLKVFRNLVLAGRIFLKGFQTNFAQVFNGQPKSPKIKTWSDWPGVFDICYGIFISDFIIFSFL